MPCPVPVHSAQEEIAEGLGMINELRNRLCGREAHQAYPHVVQAMDLWECEVNTRGLGSFTFFETIPFIDRLTAIRRWSETILQG